MTSKKNILIVGTSHTAGDCADPADIPVKKQGQFETQSGIDEYIEKMKYWKRNHLTPDQRWWQGINKKYNVTTFCNSGTSAQEQYYYLNKWLEKNPDLKFDAAILEGRLPMPASVAVPQRGGNWTKEVDDLHHWTAEYPIVDFESLGEFRKEFLSKARKDSLESYQDWYEHYILSDLGIVEVVSSCIATCKVLESIADKVAFISYTSWHATEMSQRYLMWPLKKQWGIDAIWPSYAIQTYQATDKDQDDYRCPCGHANAEGNAIISEYITPLLEEKLGLL